MARRHAGLPSRAGAVCRLGSVATGSEATIGGNPARVSARIMSDAFSAIMTTGALVSPETSVGMIEQSTTRRPPMPTVSRETVCKLWAVVEPLLPLEPDKPKGGRPRASDRAALAGLILVLRTGMQWKHLPCSEVRLQRQNELAAAGRMASGWGAGPPCTA